ncbi:MAG: alpha/beta fold hydrolase [Anaerolineae bacterium]|nr:alpha/beta fold hydrolase [Anaerolineae bacterium]
MKRNRYTLLIVLLLSACGDNTPATLLPSGELTPLPFYTAVPATVTSGLGSHPRVETATPVSYEDLSIASLARRAYGDGLILELETLDETADFRRVLISYPSDGLTINGFANLPHGEGPFPVVLVLHGYVEPNTYLVQAYTTLYADYLARAGYLVIHPNYRNHPPSDSGPNLFRVGYAVDVLNLAAIVNKQAGQTGVLQTAKRGALGLWGHSMGGGIALRVITVGANVQAAVLYAPMSGDERLNFEHINSVLSDGQRGAEELAAPLYVYPSISPIFHLERIHVPLSIHHGEADTVVPPVWSSDLCQSLQALRKPAECFTYPGQGHNLRAASETLFLQRTLDFFGRYLR